MKAFETENVMQNVTRQLEEKKQDIQFGG